MADTHDDLQRLVPAPPPGWTSSAPPAAYTPANLSEYIDGGAELFISYGFRGALAVKLADGGGQTIDVDLFDMGASANAFGVFAHSRETVDDSIGQGCEYAAGLLTFWRDRFYVSILAYPETAEKRDTVLQLGRAVAAAIGRDGPMPPLVGRLPAEGLLPASVRWFHHPAWVNGFCRVGDGNILGVGPDAPAALARYRRTGGDCCLLLVSYPDAARAREATERFRLEFLRGAESGIGRGADGRWAGCRLQAETLCVVLRAADAAAVEAMIAAAFSGTTAGRER